MMTEPDQPSVEHRRQIVLAVRSAKKVTNAAGVAAFNGFCLAFFAACALLAFCISLPFGANYVNLTIGIGLAVTAFNEFKGRRQLRQFNLAGPRLLGANQLLLMALIIGYCLFQIAVTWKSSMADLRDSISPIANYTDMNPDEIETYARMAVSLIYTLVALGSIIFQGLNSLYYFTRRKHLLAYLNNTPGWAREITQHILR